VPTEVRDADTIEPPTTFLGRLRYAGPGIIVSGSIVGSGELIATTTLGAEVGFVLLWLILFSCFIKVFLQLELGRYVISSRDTVLQALDRIPGPRLPGRLSINWLNLLWALMTFGSVLQLGGVLTGLVGVFGLESLGLGAVPKWIWPMGFAVGTAGLLVSGRYIFVEKATTLLVCLFTALTVLAVVCLQATESAITGGDLSSGLSFSIPPNGILIAFAVLGITGVGAAELVYYPYWCLEKGYARHAGEPDGTQAWTRRARGWIEVMKVDAGLSCVLYTVGTVAFYLLGAAVLHHRGIVPDDENLHVALAQLYTVSFDEVAGTWLYAAGAFAVLFSTYFVATASNSRVLADALHVFRIRVFHDSTQRRNTIRLLCVLLPMFCWAVATFVDKPVMLILIGGIAQAAILPFLAFATLYLRYRRTSREIAPFSIIDPVLWLALISTFAIGVFQIYDKLKS